MRAVMGLLSAVAARRAKARLPGTLAVFALGAMAQAAVVGLAVPGTAQTPACAVSLALQQAPRGLRAGTITIPLLVALEGSEVVTATGGLGYAVHPPDAWILSAIKGVEGQCEAFGSGAKCFLAVGPRGSVITFTISPGLEASEILTSTAVLDTNVCGGASAAATTRLFDLPDPTAPISYTVSVKSPANAAVGEPTSAVWRIGTSRVISNTMLTSELRSDLGGAVEYESVNAGPGGVCGANSTRSICHFDILYPVRDAPGLITATLTPHEPGTYTQTVVVTASGFESVIFTDTLVAQPGPLAFAVDRLYPGITPVGGLYTLTYVVSGSPQITDTRYVGTVFGPQAAYRDVSASQGACQVADSSFACDAQAPSNAITITATTEGLQEGRHAHRLAVSAAQVEPVIVTTTTNVVPPLRLILVGDLDGDGDVDIGDLRILLGDRNREVSASSCGIACDLDDDGWITVLDARKLTMLCTRPRCAE